MQLKCKDNDESGNDDDNTGDIDIECFLKQPHKQFLHHMERWCQWV